MQVIEEGLVYDANEAQLNEQFACVPSLTVLSDSSILCLFKTGSGKLSPSDNTHIMRSRNSGKRWQKHFCKFDTTLEDVRGAYSAAMEIFGPAPLNFSCYDNISITPGLGK